MDALHFLGVLAGLHKGKGKKVELKEEFLTPAMLIDRWQDAISLGTLANWRSQGHGPAFVKFGSKVLYPAAEVTKWETDRLKAANSNNKAARAS